MLKLSERPFRHHRVTIPEPRMTTIALTRRAFATACASLTFPFAVIGQADAASLQAEAARYLNAYRAQKRLGPLLPESRLVKAADTQCKIMIRNGRIGHEFGPGTRFMERLQAAGIGLRAAGENVAMGQPNVGAVMDAWMKSRGHRRNIMDPKFTHFGLAMRLAGGRPWWALVLMG
jgi:uncharacterized protein YkwD